MSPRKRKSRRVGCVVTKTTSGKLRFRFRLKLADGTMRRFSEATTLDDTPANRELVKKQAAVIGAEIQAGRFRYEKWFPNSSGKVRAGSAISRSFGASSPTVSDYYLLWVVRKKPPDVRPSLARAYRSHFEQHLLGLAGSWCLEDLSVALLLGLRDHLRNRKSGSNR